MFIGKPTVSNTFGPNVNSPLPAFVKNVLVTKLYIPGLLSDLR